MTLTFTYVTLTLNEIIVMEVFLVNISSFAYIMDCYMLGCIVFELPYLELYLDSSLLGTYCHL